MKDDDEKGEGVMKTVNVAARNLADKRYLPKIVKSKKTYNRKKIKELKVEN